MGENAAFQIAIIVNPQDYAKLNEGLSQNYVAYDIFEPLSNKTLLSIEKLNQDAYIHLSAGHLVHRGQGTAKERTFVQEQVFVRQLQKAHIQKLIGFGMFIGVLVSLVVVVAMGAILMLKRLMVAAELHDDYQTLIKIGRNPTDLRHSIIWAHIFIFASLLLLGLLQALIVANTFRLLVNNPNFQLLYLVTGICILIYGLIGALTTAIYLRAVDL
ncbi:hypothetical protein JCM14202_1375 [Agrilactobacillus composti DSM 18527 = JCM 14202]|uniref:hypothetical protein n=1 Tax=Agrilactobacillus composti TaxID=398555 RepID=UPI00042E0A52|nr:hypothetical protein [Agrilactobacillus composti]GAF39510.1 hypothetical protein JCM14202_1375 [Agrilactobacillus composti DSM 18527 = JCM 14202]